MSRIALKDFKRSNVLLMVIVVVVVLLFVFIPEFLGLAGQGALLSKNLSIDLPSAKELLPKSRSTDTTPEQPEVESGSGERLQTELNARQPLSQLEYLIDQGYIDYLVESRVQEQQGDSPEALEPAMESQSSGSAKSESDVKAREFIPRNELTWGHLQSQESLKILAEANKKSTELLGRIDTSFVQSRVALLSYISAVNQVSTDSKAFSSAKEAIELLDRLDRNVTTTFAEEGVTREIVADWAQVSLKSVLGLNRADRLKQALVPAYDPDPIIVHIVMSREASGPNYGPAKNALVGVKFIVNGEEFKEAVLERVLIVETVFLQQGKVRKFQGQLFPELYVDLLKPDLYTLVIRNKRGEEFRKVYDLRAPPYNSNIWLFDQRSNRFYLRLPYGRPNSPQLFEQRFAKVEQTSSPTYNLFDPTTSPPDVAITTF